jgi:hypothetical protein
MATSQAPPHVAGHSAGAPGLGPPDDLDGAEGSHQKTGRTSKLDRNSESKLGQGVQQSIKIHKVGRKSDEFLTMKIK